MAVFEDSLDRYMQINSIRHREYTWNRPAVPLISHAPAYSTNFALLELIDNKQPNKQRPDKFTICMKTKQPEDFSVWTVMYSLAIHASTKII